MAVLGPLRPDEEKLFHGQPKGFPLECNVDDVMLPEVSGTALPSLSAHSLDLD